MINVGFIPESYADPNHQIGGIEEVAEQFIQGYSSPGCGASGATFLFLGTNNSNALSGAFGSRWANVVATVQGYIAATPGLASIVSEGGSDIEPDFGDVQQTEAWVSGYDNASSQMLYNFGTCHNCLGAVDDPMAPAYDTCQPGAQGLPQCTLDGSHVLSGSYNGQWTEAAVVGLAGENQQEIIIPEIYSSVNALQWTYILLLANTVAIQAGDNPGIPGVYLQLPGIISQCYSAIQRHFGTTDTPAQAWQNIWTALRDPTWSAYLGGVSAQASTDIGYQTSNPSEPSVCE